MRIKTRMSMDELEDRLSKYCLMPVTLSFDGMDAKGGVDVKIVILRFGTKADRESFCAGLRGKQ